MLTSILLVQLRINDMKENRLLTLSKEFAKGTIRLYETLQVRGKVSPIINQLLRSGTSIGSNVYEANYAQSRADFISKLQIALKECYETEYWLDIFYDTQVITQEEYNFMIDQCNKIRHLLLASVKTAKQTS